MEPELTPAEDEAKRKREADLRAQLSKPDDSPGFFEFLKAIIQFIQDAFKKDDDQDFEDAPDAQSLTRERQEYSRQGGRGERERQEYQHYVKTPAQRVDPSILRQAGLDVSAMATEAKRSGKTYTPMLPVDGGRFVSEYGMRMHPLQHKMKMHQGIDIGSPVPGKPVPIKAPVPGVVIDVHYSESYGLIVEMLGIDKRRYFFAHNSKANVEPGAKVEQGQQLAMMGATGHAEGVHSHFEVRNEQGDRIDPMSVFSEAEKTRSAQVKPDTVQSADITAEATKPRVAAASGKDKKQISDKQSVLPPRTQEDKKADTHASHIFAGIPVPHLPNVEKSVKHVEDAVADAARNAAHYASLAAVNAKSKLHMLASKVSLGGWI